MEAKSFISWKPQEALKILVTEERYWTLYYMPLYTFIYNLLNVKVQIANKTGLQETQVLLLVSLRIYPITLDPVYTYVYLFNVSYIEIYR
jgi:hypothetical protein